MEDPKWQEILDAEREAMRLKMEYEVAHIALNRMLEEYKEGRNDDSR